MCTVVSWVPGGSSSSSGGSKGLGIDDLRCMKIEGRLLSCIHVISAWGSTWTANSIIDVFGSHNWAAGPQTAVLSSMLCSGTQLVAIWSMVVRMSQDNIEAKRVTRCW
ncbi:Uncharacterized protein HZ326_12995 [Fusarium oxysporum f. sp. albedinis]|nr:Uncharacterized protein HZ326_12995 [Fusarium oxysporum f. sp. albedinis]